MFYIACNTLAVTPNMTKKKALEMWENAKFDLAGIEASKYQLCKHTDRVNPTVVMDLN